MSLWEHVWAVLLGFAIVARVTRFITADSLMAPLRAWAIRRGGEDGWLATLLYCPWCVSIWVAAPVSPAVMFFGDQMWFALLGLWLGMSYGYAVLAQNLDPQ